MGSPTSFNGNIGFQGYFTQVNCYDRPRISLPSITFHDCIGGSSCPGTNVPHKENPETAQTRNHVMSESFLTPDAFKSMLDFFFFFLIAEDMLQFN